MGSHFVPPLARNLRATVGAGPSRDYDILGIKMFDSAEIRIHPTGKAIARFGTKSQGQGHETTYAQIIAEELGLPAADEFWSAPPQPWTSRRAWSGQPFPIDRALAT